MKVNDTSLNSTTASQLGKAQQAQATAPSGAKKGASAQSPNQTDQVQLSDFSSRIMAAASTDSPERAARVEKLSADYKAGRYQPDSAATSRGIVNDSISR